MARNYAFHIGGGAVTQFDGIAVKYLAVFIVGGEMLVDEIEEFFTYICSDGGVVRRVELCYGSRSGSTLGVRSIVFELILEPTVI